jgi:hypothetical protein
MGGEQKAGAGAADKYTGSGSQKWMRGGGVTVECLDDGLSVFKRKQV